jgi:hypothetical protein
MLGRSGDHGGSDQQRLARQRQAKAFKRDDRPQSYVAVRVQKFDKLMH